MQEIFSGKKVYLKQTDFETWINTRHYRYSKEAIEFDPHMPVPNEEEEKIFYDKNVINNFHLIYGLHNKSNDELLGFIVAFNFQKEDTQQVEQFQFTEKGGICETGIGIFKCDNFRKGFGKESYEIFFRLLNHKYNIKKTYILTHPDNERAKGLYIKLGFINRGIINEEGDDFLRMEYNLIQ